MKKFLWFFSGMRWTVDICSDIEPVVNAYRKIWEKLWGMDVVRSLFSAACDLLAAHPDATQIAKLLLQTFWWALLWMIPLLLVSLHFLPALGRIFVSLWDALLRLRPRVRPTSHLVFRYITPMAEEGVVDLTAHTRDNPFCFTDGFSVYQHNGDCYVRAAKTGKVYHLSENPNFMGVENKHLVKVTSIRI